MTLRSKLDIHNTPSLSFLFLLNAMLLSATLALIRKVSQDLEHPSR